MQPDFSAYMNAIFGVARIKLTSLIRLFSPFEFIALLVSRASKVVF